MSFYIYILTQLSGNRDVKTQLYLKNICLNLLQRLGFVLKYGTRRP